MGKANFKSWILKPPKDDITHGVEIYEWVESKTRTQFVLWDFAGHSEYHGTHQVSIFFLFHFISNFLFILILIFFFKNVFVIF